MSTKTHTDTRINHQPTATGEDGHRVSEFTQAMIHLRAGGIAFDVLGDQTTWAFHPLLSASPHHTEPPSVGQRSCQGVAATAA